MLGRQVEIRWRYWRPAETGELGRKKQVIAHSCRGRTCTHVHMHTCATTEHAPHMHRCSSGAKAPWSRCRTARSASQQDPRTPFLLELLGPGGLWTETSISRRAAAGASSIQRIGIEMCISAGGGRQASLNVYHRIKHYATCEMKIQTIAYLELL